MNYRTTLLLAAAVIAVAAVLYVYRDRLAGQAPPPETPAETRTLVADVPNADVARVVLQERGQDGALATRLAFERDPDDKWQMTEPVQWPADDFEVDRLLRAALTGTYRQTLKLGAQGAPAAADLDLHPPLFRLELTTKARDEKPAQTRTVDLGRQHALGGGMYVRLDGATDAVLLEDATLLARARDKISTYRRKALTDLDRNQVVRARLQGARGTARLQRGEGDRWVLAEPLSARAANDPVDDLLRAALGLRVKEFVDDAPQDLARYGLAEPRLKLTLWKKPPEPMPADDEPDESEAAQDEAPRDRAADAPEDESADADETPRARPAPAEPVEAFTVAFGTDADLKADTVYATLDGTHVVSVDADALEKIDRSPDELHDKHVVDLDKTRAARVRIQNADGAYELAKDQGADWTLRVDGRDPAKADTAAVDNLLQKIRDLQVMYFLEPKDAAKAKTADAAVRAWIEAEAGPRGFDVGRPDESRTLVRNVREDWAGRVNQEDTAWINDPWTAYLDKRVFRLEKDRATGVSIQTPDRTLVFARKDGAWTLAEPTDAQPRDRFVEDLLDTLDRAACKAYLAPGADPKKHGLDKPHAVCTVTLAPEEEGGQVVRRTLRLARGDNLIVGLAEGDLVFEAEERLLDNLAEEPLDPKLTDLDSGAVTALEVAGAGRTQALLKWDDRWYTRGNDGKPGRRFADAAPADLVSAAAKLSVWRWADYDADNLAPYGLDKPDVRIALTAADKTVTLLVSSKKVPDDVSRLTGSRPLRYAMIEGEKRVGILAGNPATRLLDAPKTLREADDKKP